MYRYVYALDNGRAFNLRYVNNGYVLKPGELEGEGFPLPSLDSLSLTLQLNPFSSTLDMGGNIREVIIGG